LIGLLSRTATKIILIAHLDEFYKQAAMPIPPNGVIYTAITAGKDQLRNPVCRIPGVSYVCFTDTPHLYASAWQVRPINWTHADPTRMAKRPKLLPHRYLQEFDWSLWIDANFEIVDDLAPFIRDHLEQGPFHALRQFQRSCAYEVVDACIKYKKDDPAILRAQAGRYRELGMPVGLPVAACGVMLRHHNAPAVARTMELWWNELENGSRRDQLSLPFVLWRYPTDFRFFFDGKPPYWNALPFLRLHTHAIPASHPW
jgi:hypothetical protein